MATRRESAARWSRIASRPCAGNVQLLVLTSGSRRRSRPTPRPPRRPARGPAPPCRSPSRRGCVPCDCVKNTILSFTAPGGKRGERGEIFDHDRIRFEAFARRCRRCRPMRASACVCGNGASTANSRFATHPVRHGGLDGVHVGKSQALHFAQGPGHGGLVARRPGGARTHFGGQRFDQLVGASDRQSARSRSVAAAERSAREKAGVLSAADAEVKKTSSKGRKNRVVLFEHVAAFDRIPREWAAILSHMYIIPRVHPFVPYGQRYRTCHRVRRRRRLDAAL